MPDSKRTCQPDRPRVGQPPARLRLCTAAGRSLLELPLRAGTLRLQRHYLQAGVFALLIMTVGGLSLAVPAALAYLRLWPPGQPPRRLLLLSRRRLWAGSQLLVWPHGAVGWQALYADELSARDFHRLRRLLIRLARSRDVVALEPIDFYRL